MFTPMGGVKQNKLLWRDINPADDWRDTIAGIKNREFGSSISASMDALAQIGLLLVEQPRGLIGPDAEISPPIEVLADIARQCTGS
jgi:hypothetical protein